MIGMKWGNSWVQVAISERDRIANERKLVGALKARKHEFWTGEVAQMSPLLPFGLAVKTGHLLRVNASMVKSQEITQWLITKSQAMNQYPRASWRDLLGVDEATFLAPELATSIESVLGNLELPMSSCHGDFHNGNIYVDSSKKFLVSDMDSFDSSGTFVFDLVHFGLCRELPAGVSWTKAIVSTSSRDRLEGFLEPFRIELSNSLLLFYSITRAKFERNQSVHKGRRQKYISAIEGILNL